MGSSTYVLLFNPYNNFLMIYITHNGQRIRITELLNQKKKAQHMAFLLLKHLQE